LYLLLQLPWSLRGHRFKAWYTNTSAIEVSADGQVIVGNAYDNYNFQFFRWTSAGGIEALGFLPGDTISFVGGVSADGSVIAGTSENASTREAFFWTKAQGMKGLGFLPMGSYSMAADISRDGQVIVGGATKGKDQVGNDILTSFRWTATDGMAELSLPDFSVITTLSADGSAIVGAYFQIGSSGSRAFRWTSNDGFLNLGLLPNGGRGCRSFFFWKLSRISLDLHQRNGAPEYFGEYV
jgi:probable HAF family extracellular repeat protein